MGCGTSKTVETGRPPGREEPTRERQDQAEVREEADDVTVDVPLGRRSGGSGRSDGQAASSQAMAASGLSGANPLRRQENPQSLDPGDAEKRAPAATPGTDADSVARDTYRPDGQSSPDDVGPAKKSDDLPAATRESENLQGGEGNGGNEGDPNDRPSELDNSNQNERVSPEEEILSPSNVSPAVLSGQNVPPAEEQSSSEILLTDGDEDFKDHAPEQEREQQRDSEPQGTPIEKSTDDDSIKPDSVETETNEGPENEELGNTKDKEDQAQPPQRPGSIEGTSGHAEASGDQDVDGPQKPASSGLAAMLGDAAPEISLGKTGDRTDKPAKERVKKTEVGVKATTPGKVDKVIRERLVQGDLDLMCPPTAKVVRVFLSSPFTDSRGERNVILKGTYERLREKCRGLGYEFQLVDMRWGVEHSITDLHQTTALCLHEIQQCRRISTGPNFLAMLSHRYGAFSCPDSLPKEEMEVILEAEPDDRDFLVGHESKESSENGSTEENHGWFVLDTNIDPPSYVLRPISYKYPDILSKELQKHRDAGSNWWKDEARIMQIIRAATRKRKGEEAAKACIRGVTELEIEHGLQESEDSDVKNTFLWLHRNVEDIENHKDDKVFTRFMDTLGEEEEQLKAELMVELKKKMVEKLPDDNIKSYNVKWEILPKGKSKEDIPEHELETLAKTGGWLTWLEDRLWQQIEQAAAERQKNEVEDPLLVELMQHVTLAQRTLEDFSGRDTILEAVEKYVRDPENHRPLVLHGESGCGKTAVVAMTAKKANEWLDGKGVIVTRFVGTTPDSSRVSTLLESFTEQILTFFGESRKKEDSQDFNQISEDFKEILKKASESKPVLILLDSFDQLDPMEEAMNLSWIPKKLPKYVKLIISVLTDTEGQEATASGKDNIEKGNNLYKKLTDEFLKRREANIVKVESLTESESEKLMHAYLKKRNRAVTEDQKREVFKAMEQCGLPLFLRLTFEEISRWSSFQPPEESLLKTTLDDAIEAFFSRLERLHSKELVSTALGLLTVARRGLTDAELEDVLSCDDQVLDTLYTFHTPPVRRLPPLILARLREELKQYIMTTEVDGVLVLQWNHARFKEVARRLYCQDADRPQALYRAIADFFSSDLPHDQAEERTKRCVEEQPLKRGDKYNIRKLSNLPWALMGADGDGKGALALKKQCLCNFDFLLGKLEALGFRSLLEDFAEAVERYPDDEDIRVVQGALHLSQRAVHNDVKLLPGQLIERLDRYTKKKREEGGEETAVGRLLEQCWEAPFPFLAADNAILETPGGSLKHTLPSHGSDVIGLQVTPDGNMAVTGDTQGMLRVWDLSTGKSPHNIQHDVGTPSQIFFSTCGQLAQEGKSHRVLVRDEKAVTVYKLDTGRQDESLVFADHGLSSPVVTVTGPENEYIVCLEDDRALRANVGKCRPDKFSISAMDVGSIGAKSLAAGSPNLVAVTDEDRYILRLLSSKTLRDSNAGKACKRIFPEYDVPDNTEGLGPKLTAICFHPDASEILVAASHSPKIFVLETQMLKQRRAISGYMDDPPLSLAVAFDKENKKPYVYFPSKSTVTTISLIGGRDVTVTSHRPKVVLAATADMETMVTVGSDHVVKVWNIQEATESREVWAESAKSETKTKDSVGMIRSLYPCPEAPSSEAPLSGAPRYVVALKASPDSQKWLLVHDLEEGKVVRQAKFCQDGHLELEVLPSSKKELNAVVKIRDKEDGETGRLALVDLDAMKVVRRFSHCVSFKESSEERTFCFLKKHSLILALNVTAKKFVLITMENEEEKGISAKGEVTSFKVNVQETVLAALLDEDEEAVAVFSLPRGQALRRVTAEALLVEDADFLSLEAISADGKRLMLDVSGTLRIWDTTKGSKGDIAEAQPENDGEGDEVELNSVAALDNVSIACGYREGVVRVYNLATGKRLVNEECHSGVVEVMSQPWNRTYFLSFGLELRDQKLVLWSKPSRDQVRQLATYLPDTPLDAVQLGGGEEGGLVVGAVRNPVRVTTWRVAGQGYGKPQKRRPVLFTETKLDMDLDLQDKSVPLPPEKAELSDSSDDDST